MKRNRIVLRTAAALHQRLLASWRSNSQLAQSVESLASVHRYVQETYQQLNRARRHGLHLAAECLQQTLRTQIQSLHMLTCQVTSEGLLESPPAAPSLGTLMLDLQQLQQEFEQVEFQLKEGRIRVETDAITLDGLHLGRFAIELHLERLCRRIESSVFDCVALDPNPASTSDDTTHPHVKDKVLCAGDAAAGIANAIRQGRITDAFCLINAVLHTYNRQSPYVAIEDWDGVRCPDCDDVVDRDHLYFCEHCENDYCDNCISTCDVCDSSCCRGCLEKDVVSRRLCCSNCRHTCGDCDRIVDADSFDDETELCPECHAKRQADQSTPEIEEPEHDHQASTPATA